MYLIGGDRQDLIQALDNGSIDAAALSYIGAAKKYRAVAEFASQDMYFAVAPMHPELLSELNAAMPRDCSTKPEKRKKKMALVPKA